jgi:hypothetical protein
MKSLSRHSDLFELVFELLRRAIHMGVGWLMRLVRHAVWAEFSISCTCQYFQCPRYYNFPTLTHDPLRRHIGLLLILLEVSVVI